MTEFTCDPSSPAKPFPHFWEECVGSDHARMGLRADWQKQLAQVHRELGFKRVRFHGILNDDMGTLLTEHGRKIYSFFNADQVFDYILSIGMQPFVELSFMPSTIASGEKTVFYYKANVTLPKSLEEWRNLIDKLFVHWRDRYGAKEVAEWFIEVWNEPNMIAFWTGSQTEYFEFFKTTFNAIKNIVPDAKVGGPATAANAWISDFVAYCAKNSISPDFISTHHYPTDPFGAPDLDTVSQLAESGRDDLRAQAALAKVQSKGKPLYYTEWNVTSNPFDDLHDRALSAAYIINNIVEMQGLVDGYSYWTFSDIFEENYFAGVPFHGGFGLLTVHGIAKPAYRAFQFLHNLGDEQLPLEGSHETVRAYAFRCGHNIQILLCNWNLPRHAIKSETMRICVKAKPRTAAIERIDSKHANPREVWEQMGSPDSLRPEKVEELKRASETGKENLEFEIHASDATVEVTLEANSVALITLTH